MRVLFVTAEAYPLAKTGGLADVSHALPLALSNLGLDVRLLLPGYPRALKRLESPRIVGRIEPLLGICDAKLVYGTLPDAQVPVLLIDAPSLFRRDGGLYQDADGRDWPDNALRFAFLAHVGAMIATGRSELDWSADIVHANDWHAGLLPLLLAQKAAPRPATIFTTHNMAFQGNFPVDVLRHIGIRESRFENGDIEFYGQVSFLKAGLHYADKITTVSPSYAKEILAPEYGFGLDGLLRARGADLHGILNGIDDIFWDPSADRYLAQPYKAGAVAGKKACKAALQREAGLPVSPDAPLVGFGSRLTHQKMADVILSVIPALVAKGAQFALVGEGEATFEAAFGRMQADFPKAVSVHIGYSEARAHRLHAGSDILLAPARFEPCGLTQLYAMRYGALPIVRKTGGLADTVIDATPSSLASGTATGFVINDPCAGELTASLDRAIALYREPLVWRRLQNIAMSQNFGWGASARSYLSLYSELSPSPARPAASEGARQDGPQGEKPRLRVLPSADAERAERRLDFAG